MSYFAKVALVSTSDIPLGTFRIFGKDGKDGYWGKDSGAVQVVGFMRDIIFPAGLHGA